MLVILTSVDKVCLHFGTEQEQALDYLSVEDASRYADQGMFGADDMLPKIRAAIEFIGDSAIRKVLITRLKGQEKTIAGQRGTMIGK